MMTYPIFSILLAIGVGYGMLTKMVPELKKFLSMSGKRLPPATQALVDISAWCQANLKQWIIGLVVAIAVMAGVYLIPRVRVHVDRAVLRAPLLGTLIQLSETRLFAAALATMLRAGVHIMNALEIMGQLHTNRHIRGCMDKARQSLANGSSLWEPLTEYGIFKPMLVKMIAVGEKSGSLIGILDEMATFHQDAIEKYMKRISGVVPVIMTFVVGGMMVFVYLAYMLAMFSAAGGVKR